MASRGCLPPGNTVVVVSVGHSGHARSPSRGRSSTTHLSAVVRLVLCRAVHPRVFPGTSVDRETQKTRAPTVSPRNGRHAERHRGRPAGSNLSSNRASTFATFATKCAYFAANCASTCATTAAWSASPVAIRSSCFSTRRVAGDASFDVDGVVPGDERAAQVGDIDGSAFCSIASPCASFSTLWM